MGARRARGATGDPRVRRVGDVDDHQLAATGVDVLDVAGRGLHQVDADQGEAAYLAVGVGALPQFIASFSNCSDGSTPVSAGRVGDETS